MIRRFLDALREKWTLGLAGLMLAAAVAGSLLWYGRLGSFPIRATLIARHVNIATGPAGIIDPYRQVALSSARTFGKAAVRAIPPLNGLQDGPVEVAGPISLSAIRIPPGARASFDAVDARCIDINVEGASLQIDLQGDRAVVAQHERRWSTSTLLTVAATAVRLCFATPAVLRFYEASQLDVTETASPLPGAPLQISTLRSGTISLPFADRSITLERDEAMVLGGFRGMASLRLGADPSGAVELLASGRATAVSSGVPGLERDLRPRWIEYLNARDILGGLLATILACWSISTSAAAFLRRRE
ncbi:hypothetical protein HNP52_000034 [Sphingomonas kyeonggiensis]|uniref:Uncharacterized protein n=1 Tax=Sphingomonas kyeonggiensis TaxID=1268553 RepID=A0A7W7JXM0_9SPHN|nr:hypothetical protein [Sphingomonas kyeonggiensis]MBB4836983.1 hypothetical protein [Sphingomonas kyeonggiensis]